LTYDTDLQKKLESLGLELPKELQAEVDKSQVAE